MALRLSGMLELLAEQVVAESLKMQIGVIWILLWLAVDGEQHHCYSQRPFRHGESSAPPPQWGDS